VLFWSWLPVCLVAAAAAIGPGLPRPVADVASAAMVGLIGVPHGATDHILFGRLTGTGATQRSSWAHAAEIMGYLAVMAAVAALIFFQPVLGVCAFLALSSYHFGLSHGDRFSLRLVFLGGAIVHQLSAWHAGDVLAISEVLAPGRGGEVARVFDVVGLSGTVGFGALAIGALLERTTEPGSRSAIAKEITLLAAVAYLSAQNGLLWSFAVYFSLGHAVEGWRQQFAEQQAVTDRFWEYYCLALPFTLLCYTGGAGIAWLVDGDALASSAALAALLAGPVPHIFLQEWAWPCCYGAVLDRDVMAYLPWRLPHQEHGLRRQYCHHVRARRLLDR